MPKNNARRQVAREKATLFLTSFSADIACVACGNSPVEWHKEGHEDRPNSRVSSLRSQGASIRRIKEEILTCTPVCRSCHMKLDGRLVALSNKQPYKKGVTYVVAQPCKQCGKKEKPLRRKLCNKCYCVLMNIRQPKKVG